MPHSVCVLPAILGELVHQEVATHGRVVMTAPVVAQLMASHSHHLGQDHDVPTKVVGAEASVVDDQVTEGISEPCDHKRGVARKCGVEWGGRKEREVTEMRERKVEQKIERSEKVRVHQ